jgi:rsbT co-antagonist protein RsbR
MKKEYQAVLAALAEEESVILEEWVAEVRATDPGAPKALQGQASELLRPLRDAIKAGADPGTPDAPQWSGVHQVLDALSRSRAAQGQTAGDTSAFVLAAKKPLFAALQRRLGSDAAQLVAVLWSISSLVDKLAQRTVNTYQQSREDIIRRQQQELLELSTPVIKLWDGVLAVPMIGTLDSNRTQLVMETLLQQIVETESTLAIIDITGVPTVDTLVAQHLLKTVSAIRLMGADCIISGIRPQIAQTIVHLGIDLQGITSKATLADALSVALQRTGYRVIRDK